MNDIIAQNKASWDAIADSFFGVTALPIYGCLCPTEDELHLFPNLARKKVFDIGCGSGHSLKSAEQVRGLPLLSLFGTEHRDHNREYLSYGYHKWRIPTFSDLKIPILCQ